ncbi:MAG: thiol peroxidase [Clostridiales bacterium]|nr:thiol peroxidase [Clostridiales bacterium]
MNLTFANKPIELLGKTTEIGIEAPDFEAVNLDLSRFIFSNMDKHKIKVISVAPSLDTNVCSLQTIRFNEEAGKLKDSVELIAISMDLPFALKRYCAAEGIENINVLSDYQIHDFGMKYGFLIRGLKLLTRGVIVIDKEGIVRYVEYVPEVTNEPNYDKALEAIKELL